MKQLTLILCLGLWMAGNLSAQTGTISGTVLEAESGFEVIGGNVLVIGQEGLGTVTDLDGSYQLELEAGTYTIEFSYIGFASQQMAFIDLDGKLILKSGLELNELPINAQPDARILEGDFGQLLIFTDPTDAYPHAIMGDN
ncbi:MAG: carboxypeptidase-like regulatory domain-containing protein, partial [Bacteroidota bacterium]